MDCNHEIIKPQIILTDNGYILELVCYIDILAMDRNTLFDSLRTTGFEIVRDEIRASDEKLNIVLRYPIPLSCGALIEIYDDDSKLITPAQSSLILAFYARFDTSSKPVDLLKSQIEKCGFIITEIENHSEGQIDFLLHLHIPLDTCFSMLFQGRE